MSAEDCEDHEARRVADRALQAIEHHEAQCVIASQENQKAHTRIELGVNRVENHIWAAWATLTMLLIAALAFFLTRELQ